MVVGLLSDEELPSSADREDPIEFLWADVLHVAKVFQARVGHDNVELSKVIDGLFEQWF